MFVCLFTSVEPSLRSRTTAPSFVTMRDSSLEREASQICPRGKRCFTNTPGSCGEDTPGHTDTHKFMNASSCLRRQQQASLTSSFLPQKLQQQAAGNRQTEAAERPVLARWWSWGRWGSGVALGLLRILLHPPGGGRATDGDEGVFRLLGTH